MANTKVTTRVIADDAITSDKLASGLTLGGNTTATGNLILDSSAHNYIELHSSTSNTRKWRFYNGQAWNPDALLIYDQDADSTALTIETNKLGISRGAASLSHTLDVGGNVAISGTEIIDSSRNMSNLGTVSATTFSGALSGTIASATTATTQSASDNSTKVATTAFVGTAVSNLVASAPSTLDTLNELAAALGDDANFSTTVTNSIATKAAISGQVFTGNVSIRGNGNLEVGGYAGGTDYGLLLTPADSANHYHLYTDTGGHLAFGAHGTIGSGEKMRLKSDGQLLLGISNSDVGFSTNAFELSGNIRMQGGNFGIKANDGSYEYHLVRSVASNNVYLANDRIQVGAATGFVKITGGSASGLQVDGPIKTGGSGNYILFDYDGDMTGSNYYAIQDTSDDKLRISRAFSTTDCLELDSSGNLELKGGNLTISGNITTNTSTINGITLGSFKRSDQTGSTAEAGAWYSTSSYVYDVTNGVRFYWIKVLTMPSSNCRGILEYVTKSDENYPHFSKGTIAFSSFNGGASFSVQHDQSTAEGVAVTCRLDTSRALWVQFSASWASNSKWRITQFASSSTIETSWTVGSNKLDPASTSVPPNSSSNIDAGKNLRATSSSVTGAVPTYDFYKKGNVRSDLQVVDTNVVYNGAVPLNFHYKGSDTYTKTVLYDGQNDTANNVFSGLTWEMGRLTNSSSATPRTFTISDRGAGNKWCFSQYGLSFNPASNVASAAESLDDYEEGNFTPTFQASGGTAPSSQTGTGQYTKIGDVVHITGQISWSGNGSGGSNLYINLPFNLISDARAGMAIGLNSGVTYPQDHTLHLVPEINTNVMYVISTHYSTAGHTHLTFSSVSSGSRLFSFSGSFHTRD